MLIKAEQRPDLADVLLEHPSRPRPRRQHIPTLRSTPPRALPMTDTNDPAATETRLLRVGQQVAHIQADQLGAAQPPPVADLEHRAVAQRRQTALAL